MAVGEGMRISCWGAMCAVSFSTLGRDSELCALPKLRCALCSCVRHRCRESVYDAVAISRSSPTHIRIQVCRYLLPSGLDIGFCASTNQTNDNDDLPHRHRTPARR